MATLSLLFDNRISHGEVLAAEMEGILQGSHVFQDRNIWNLIIETDSEMAFNLITKQHSEAWKYTYTVWRIRRLLVLSQGL